MCIKTATRIAISFTVSACLLGASATHAAVLWAEQSPGAGDTIATAQSTSGASPGSLSAITGTLNAFVPQSGTPLYEVDVFRIFVTDVDCFSARTVSNNAQDDTSLFLFNSAGAGVFMNDDTGSDLLSFLPAGDPTCTGGGPAVNDFFFLAVSLGGFEAHDTTTGADMFQPGQFTDVRSGDPAAGPLATWADPFGRQAETPFDYRIELTGARVANVVPEPAPLALLLAALGTFAATRRPARRPI